MTGVGFGAGRLTADDSPSAGVAATPVTEPTSSTATTDNDTPVTGNPDEPVEAVARALAPAVVQIETSQGLGSGFVYDPSGLVLTAAHVTDGNNQVTVRTADGKAHEGKVLGADNGSDVAVVKIDPSADLKVAQLAVGEDVQVGQMAVAIGSPFGLDQTVTSGIVSAVDRTVETPGGAIPMLQTDAPINPGNSGGALADRRGRVIGINDSIASESGGNQGVGFAVPIDTAVSVAQKLVKGETIKTGYLGVTPADASQTGGAEGALIVQVDPASPARHAGLERGDLVTSVDGKPVTSSTDLIAAIRSRAPGAAVTLTYQRDGASHQVHVTLGTLGSR
ncbi:MAG: trypsin-like peptidase domain-containing protein [Acidimicrobiia bacterium]|nr:trypsin-like peptidase domain-containing protein [Acidimicrobiia bacterium]